jgi:hypothetical protein
MATLSAKTNEVVGFQLPVVSRLAFAVRKVGITGEIVGSDGRGQLKVKGEKLKVKPLIPSLARVARRPLPEVERGNKTGIKTV